MELDIDISELQAAWDKEQQALHADLTSSVKHACEEGAAEALNTHIYQDQTAQLSASIHGDEFLMITADGAEGQITAGEDYASYVNDWEANNKAPNGFMDRGHDKAEEILGTDVNLAILELEARLNR